MPPKKRLDQLLIDTGNASSLKEAEALIRAGKVLTEEKIADKPGELFPDSIKIRVKTNLPFVSRGGVKLQGALSHFNINPLGWTCADIGASTGGFTDCLLQNGAASVYAIDVAYGQLAWKLRTDPRVIVIERLNVRKITSKHIRHQIDLAVFDTSFISLKSVIPPVLPFFGKEIKILAMVKPQFELPRAQVAKGGVVLTEKLHTEAVNAIIEFGQEYDLNPQGYVAAEIKGPKGNQEYFVYFKGQQK